MANARADLRAVVVAAVVNFNRPDLTLAVVRQLLSLATSRASVRVLIVDDASSEEKWEALVRGTPPGIELMRLGKNSGYAAAANCALAHAREVDARFLWLLNNDLTIPPDALDQMLSVAMTVPGLAALVPVVVSAGPDPSILSAGLDVVLWRGVARHRYYGQPLSAVPTGPFFVDAVEGSAILIDMKAEQRIGGFDTGFFMYWEDTEWSTRARAAGFRLAVVPASRVSHLLGQSSTAQGRLELMMRNRIRFVRLTGSAIDRLAFAAYFFLAWMPAFIALRLIPRFGVAAAARISYRAVAWNVADVVSRRRWKLRADDQLLGTPPYRILGRTSDRR